MFSFRDKITLGNVFLAADADGTLLTDDKRVLDKDKAAIRELCDKGGLFTIATGRGVTYARPIAEEFGLEIPAVIFNGAAVYDFNKDRFLWQCSLSPTAREHMLMFVERFPSLGIEILCGYEVYVIAANRRTEDHIKLTDVAPTRCSLDDIPLDNWTKVLLEDEPEVIDELVKFAGNSSISDLHLVRSGPCYYEMLPFGINKGTALGILMDIANIKDRCIVAVGDYMNDIEMLRMADVKIAVANAEDMVKAEAELIVCDNNSGAAYEIVEWLKGAAR